MEKIKSSEILALYDFLCIFESELKRIDTDSKFEKLYPKTKKLIKALLKKNVTKSKSKEIANTGYHDNKVYMTIQKTQLLCFLRHLRNSFAHNLIYTEKNFYCFEDKYRGTLTAKGKISITETNSVLTQIAKENKSRL